MLNKISKSYQICLKFCQSGKISPNLVTLACMHARRNSIKSDAKTKSISRWMDAAFEMENMDKLKGVKMWQKQRPFNTWDDREYLTVYRSFLSPPPPYYLWSRHSSSSWTEFPIIIFIKPMWPDSYDDNLIIVTEI